MKKIIASALFLLGFSAAHAQYMSFFGDNTWEYHQIVVTQPPESYLDFPPENPSPLGVYCQTFSFRFNKNNPYSDYPLEHGYLSDHGSVYTDSLVWDYYGLFIREDTVNGRLYNGLRLICDMSLSEGDTFCLLGYDSPDYHLLVDSVRFVDGRKIIFLSLIDNQNDYFFGTTYVNQHPEYRFSIRFIEGIGPTYGIQHWGAWALPPAGTHIQHGYDFLSLSLCLHKDDSLVYLADERLGCIQTTVGLSDYPDITMNLYPNPSTQYVILDMSTGDEMNGTIEIADMLGRLCLVQKAEGTKCQIAVSDLPTGMYFLTYTDGNRKVTRKFLKG